LATAQANLALARGSTNIARGPFDVTVGGGLDHAHDVLPSFTAPGVAEAARSDTTSLSAFANTNLVWGTNIRATASLVRRDDDEDRVLLSAPQRALTQLAVTQPLLRNAGRSGAASGILAGEYAERAAEHTAAHVAQLQAFTVIAAYWDLVGADAELTLSHDAEARAQRMLAETQVLVEADRRPRGDLRALEAGYAGRRREVIEAQRSRVRAIYVLGLAMGLELNEAADWEPSDGFPEPALPPIAPSQLAERAVSVRRDLKAAEASLRSAGAALSGADHNALPKLDLTVAVGYNGAVDRDGVGPFFDALGRNIQGVNASGGVNLEVPLDNTLARGLREQASAQRWLAETALADLARNTRMNVVAAYEELRAEVESVGAAKEAEAAYTQALDDERAKLRAGLATVLDTVFTEDLLTDATRARIATELAVAQALARLRLELGSLPSSEPTAAHALLGVLDAGALDDQ
jgi:outer membrane protein TolC